MLRDPKGEHPADRHQPRGEAARMAEASQADLVDPQFDQTDKSDAAPGQGA